MTMIPADKKNPVLICRTCGLATKKFSRRIAFDLIKEKRKTWKRTIKPTQHIVFHRGKNVKCREIFFSYLLTDCIRNRHKLSVRKAPFSSKLVKDQKGKCRLL